MCIRDSSLVAHSLYHISIRRSSRSLNFCLRFDHYVITSFLTYSCRVIWEDVFKLRLNGSSLLIANYAPHIFTVYYWQTLIISPCRTISLPFPPTYKFSDFCISILKSLYEHSFNRFLTTNEVPYDCCRDIRQDVFRLCLNGSSFLLSPDSTRIHML